MMAVFVPSLHDLLHPLEGLGYQFWSGIGSDFGQLTLITGLLVAIWRARKHLECHVEAPKNCHRIGHRVPGTGHYACRKHHPHAQEKGKGTTAADILKHHEESERVGILKTTRTGKAVE
jgi:hypothetical protein